MIWITVWIIWIWAFLKRSYNQIILGWILMIVQELSSLGGGLRSPSVLVVFFVCFYHLIICHVVCLHLGHMPNCPCDVLVFPQRCHTWETGYFMVNASSFQIILIVSTRCIQWILWFSIHYAAACKKISNVNALSGKLHQLASPDLQGILIGRILWD